MSQKMAVEILADTSSSCSGTIRRIELICTIPSFRRPSRNNQRHNDRESNRILNGAYCVTEPLSSYLRLVLAGFRKARNDYKHDSFRIAAFVSPRYGSTDA